MSLAKHDSSGPRHRQSMALLIPSYPGQRSAAELDREARAGLRPRRAWNELARLLGAEIIDTDYLTNRGKALSQAVARRIGVPGGQICEAFLRRAEHGVVCAWDDRLGVPLALLYKLLRRPPHLILVSDWLSRPKKAVLVRYLRAHTRLSAIVNSSSVQMEVAIRELGVPRQKLHHVPLPVDDEFWKPQPRSVDDMICAVGMEARDYSTLLAAVRGLDLQVELAVGTIVLAPGGQRSSGGNEDHEAFDLLKGSLGYKLYRTWSGEVRNELPPNVRMNTQLSPVELRDLYARALLVVVPLQDVDSDCGMSTLTEAMAMGKPVIITRTRGQVDVLEDGVQGTYVPPYDAEALRTAIARLVGDAAAIERMGKAGRALVERQHSLDAHVSRMMQLLMDQNAGAPDSSRPIVIFTPGYSEPGGLSKRTRLLASSLAARGWKVRVVARATARWVPRLVRSPNLTILEIPGFGQDRIGTALFIPAAVVVGTIWGWRAPVLMSIKLLSSTTAAALCSSLLRRPYVAVATSSGESSEATFLSRKGPLSHIVRRRMLRRARFLVAQTAEASQELSSLVPPGRMAIVPTPVEQVKAPALTGTPKAVFTGRLSKDKDLFTLIDAWRMVTTEYPDATLTLVGEGGPHEPVEQQLRRAAEDDPLLSSVHFTGWLSDVSPILTVSDVFVLPSRSEGMSNALLEACAWGRVVVASDIFPNRAVLGDDYPLLYPVGETSALAAALKQAFTDGDIREAARERAIAAAAAFSLDSVVDRLEAVLYKACEDVPQEYLTPPATPPTLCE